MNVFQRIKTIANSLNLPACEGVYTGNASKWITYNLVDNMGVGFSDNRPDEFRDEVQVHLFMPLSENFFSLMRSIRTKLIEADFYNLDITTDEETDKQLRHIIFTASRLE